MTAHVGRPSWRELLAAGAGTQHTVALTWGEATEVLAALEQAEGTSRRFAERIAELTTRDDQAVLAVARVEALLVDPWVARNHGELARYQEGVVRRGAIAYGEFVKVADLRAALARPEGGS